MADIRVTSDGSTRITSGGDTRIVAAAAPTVPVVSLATPRFSMVDALLVFGDWGVDLSLEANDLSREQGLMTAVMISLFSDARADLEELPHGDTAQRGWWPDSEADRYGSKLWLLAREKTTSETVIKAKRWTEQALAWLVEDGICVAVDVTAGRIDTYTIGISATLRRGFGKQWQHLWDGVTATSVNVDGFSFSIETA